jgi:hypothetical protein
MNREALLVQGLDVARESNNDPKKRISFFNIHIVQQLSYLSFALGNFVVRFFACNS